MNKLFNSPFDDRSSFLFSVKKFQGHYFIREISTSSSDGQSGDAYDAQLYLSKFKDFITVPIVGENYTPPKDVVSTWEQMQRTFCCTITSISSIEPLKVFYGSEIDALDKCKFGLIIDLFQ